MGDRHHPLVARTRCMAKTRLSDDSWVAKKIREPPRKEPVSSSDRATRPSTCDCVCPHQVIHSHAGFAPTRQVDLILCC